MKGRPFCAVAVLLILILLAGMLLGVSEKVPRISSEQTEEVRVTGRVVQLRQTVQGTQLLIDRYSILMPGREASSADVISGRNENDHTAVQKQFIHDQTEQNLSFQSITVQNQATDSNSASLQDLYDLAGTEDPVPQISPASSGKQLQNKNSITDNCIQGDPAHRIQVYLRKGTSEPLQGDWVLLTGELCQLQSPVCPGQFDQKSYNRQKKIDFLLKKANITKIRSNGKQPDLLQQLKERMLRVLRQIMEPEDAGIMEAMLLGERDSLSPDTKKLYQEGGIAHLLAISSLHMTILGMLLYRVLRKLELSFAVSGIISGCVLLAYCVMAGFSASAMRAGIMFLLWLGSQILGRTCDTMNSLGIAAVVILLTNPQQLDNSGFLLSFACVLSMELLTPVVESILPLPEPLRQRLAPSLAIQLGTLPIIESFYYQITPYAILANLIILPFMEVLMLSGIAGILAGMLLIPAGIIAAAPCHYLLRIMEWICRMERQLPGAVLITGCPAWIQIAGYYLCLFMIVLTGRKKLLLLLSAVVIISIRVDPELRITFLDVGQGDCILIEQGGFTAMIDGGSSSMDQVWSQRIERALKYYGRDHLDLVLPSHGDQDHISGIRELLADYECSSWGTNIGGISVDHLVLAEGDAEDAKIQELAELAAEHLIPVSHLEAGDQVETGKMTLTCLYPETDAQRAGAEADLLPADETAAGVRPPRVVSEEERNSSSAVYLLRYGDFSALFTGDLPSEDEQTVIENLDGHKVTVLKVAHHGSKNSTSEQFLSVVCPEIAVISSGKNNLYGHPHEETLERLEAAGSKVYRTDQCGTVSIRKRGTGIEIVTWKKPIEVQ